MVYSLYPVPIRNNIFSELYVSITFGKTPCTSDQPVARPLLTQDSSTQKHNTNIHASNGIQTHDTSNQEVKTYALDRVTGRLFKFTANMATGKILRRQRRWM
jgi:hypothetical protein